MCARTATAFRDTMRTSEFYFYHGGRDVPEPGEVLPTLACCMRSPLPPRPHDRLTSSVRNHSWWVSTQLRPQIQGQPLGQSMYSQPSEVRHDMRRSEPFLTGQRSLLSSTSRLAPHLVNRQPWTLAPTRHEMYSHRLGFRTEDLHQMREFSSTNITARLIDMPSGPMRGQYPVPPHVRRRVTELARVWTPRSGTGRAATARQVHSDLDNFEARLATRPVPPAEPKPAVGFE